MASKTAHIAKGADEQRLAISMEVMDGCDLRMRSHAGMNARKGHPAH